MLQFNTPDGPKPITHYYLIISEGGAPLGTPATSLDDAKALVATWKAENRQARKAGGAVRARVTLAVVSREWLEDHDDAAEKWAIGEVVEHYHLDGSVVAPPSHPWEIDVLQLLPLSYLPGSPLLG